jgi:hypothetical protein
MTTTKRYLFEIAEDITKAANDYSTEKGKAPSWWYYSAQYVEALRSLETIDQMYFYDTADSVVRYLLSNLTTWRGEQARKIKEELKSMLTY